MSYQLIFITGQPDAERIQQVATAAVPLGGHIAATTPSPPAQLLLPQANPGACSATTPLTRPKVSVSGRRPMAQGQKLVHRGICPHRLRKFQMFLKPLRQQFYLLWLVMFQLHQHDLQPSRTLVSLQVLDDLRSFRQLQLRDHPRHHNAQEKAAQGSQGVKSTPKAPTEPPTLTAEEILTPGKASLKDQPPTGSSDVTVKKWLQQHPQETQQMVVKLQSVISEYLFPKSFKGLNMHP